MELEGTVAVHYEGTFALWPPFQMLTDFHLERKVDSAGLRSRSHKSIRPQGTRIQGEGADIASLERPN